MKKIAMQKTTMKIAVRPEYEYLFNKIAYNCYTRRDTLSDRLIAYTEKNGISRKELGRYLHDYAAQYGVNIAVQTVYHYMSGRCCPKIDRLTIMAEAMDVSVQWLTGYGPRSSMNNSRIVWEAKAGSKAKTPRMEQKKAA